MFNSLPFNKLMERMPEVYVPYIGHVTDGTVLLKDGSRLAMVKLASAPFELIAPEVRKNRALTINDLLRRLPVHQVCIHLVKHDAAPVARPLECSNAYGRNLLSRYNDVALGADLRSISWFISLIVRPSGRTWFGRKDHDQDHADHEASETLEYATRTLMGTLSEHAPRRLGRREIPTDMPDETVTMSEIGSALYLIRTGFEADIPETAGTLGSAILAVSPEFGKRAFDLRLPGKPRYGAMVSLKDYPSKTRTGMLNELLSADFAFSMTHAFSYENSRLNQASLAFRSIHLANTGGGSETLGKGLTKMADDRSSNKSTTGMHNFAMAVFSPQLEYLERNVGTAMTALTRYGGATPVKERNAWFSGAMEGQYWSLLPGVIWTHCRSGQISTLNLAHLASLEGYSVGQAKGFWGRSPFRLRTRAGTAFDFIPMVEEVPHTWVVGPSGGGKSVFASFLKTAMAPVLGADGLRLLIDKDGSNRISIEMEGGSYATFRRNEASGTAPLKFLEDTPRNRAFFHSLYSWLIMRDGRGTLNNEDEHRLMRGIARQMKMPKAERSMAGVRELMGYADPVNGAGARFEKWCAGGPMGWLLDGDRHLIDLDPHKARLYGFDFGALLPKEGEADDGASRAIASVIAHQLGGLIDGRRIMCIFEECHFYLEPLAKLIDDVTLTGRKNDLMVVLITPQPEHFLDSPIGLSLMSQCRTKIMFPDKSAARKTYVDRMGLPPQVYEQLAHGMFVGEAGRRFLLWRGQDESAICEFDLSKMQDEVAIMSARASTNRILDGIKTNPDLSLSDMRDEFLRQNTRRLALQEEAA